MFCPETGARAADPRRPVSCGVPRLLGLTSLLCEAGLSTPAPEEQVTTVWVPKGDLSQRLCPVLVAVTCCWEFWDAAHWGSFLGVRSGPERKGEGLRL